LFKALFRREARAHDDSPAFQIGMYREGMRRNHSPPHLNESAFGIAATNEWSLAQIGKGGARLPAQK